MITLPAIKGKIGTTEYYLTSMSARELVSSVKPADELEEWESMTIEEKMQREPNWNRIKKEIAPYFANSPDRFLGTIIVSTRNAVLSFRSQEEMTSVKQGYESVLGSGIKKLQEKIGLLSIDGGVLIALDGQHRLLALRNVIQDKDGSDGEFKWEVPNDDISVMFISHTDHQKTRNTFTVLNRYAKSTSANQNYTIDDMDGIAIVNRKVIRPSLNNNPLLKEAQVNLEGSALPDRSAKFTTLSALYNMTASIIDGFTDFDWNKQVRPEEIELQEAEQTVLNFLGKIFKNVDGFNLAINGEGPQTMRKPSEKYSVLMKPIAQMAVVDAIVRLKKLGIEFEKILEDINKLKWSMSDKFWEGVLIKSDGKIDAGKTARDRVASLIVYMLGKPELSEKELIDIKKQYQTGFFKKDELPDDQDLWKKLPEPING